MTTTALKPPQNDLYERDFHAWTQQQADALTRRDAAALDVMNLVDEVFSLGLSQRRAIETHLIVLTIHLLKFVIQPERRSPSWSRTLRNARREIGKLVARNPSLASYPTQIFSEAYADAVRRAAYETGLQEHDFPTECPFSLEQALDPHFEPKGEVG